MKGIEHHFLSYACTVLADTDTGLKNDEIEAQLGKYATKFGVKLRPFYNYEKKSTKLRVGLQQFSGEEQYQIIQDLCALSKFQGNEEVSEVLDLLQEKYSYFSPEPISKSQLVQKTQHWLEKYPQAKQVYDSALSKIEKEQYERNALDDMRLSLEILVREILGNEKTLENNIPLLNGKLKENGASPEIRNMFEKIFDYYTKFQNNHVKHAEKVEHSEIESVIELTTVLMKYLIRMLGVAN